MRLLMFALLLMVTTGCYFKHPLRQEEECEDCDAWYLDWSSKPPVKVDTYDASKVVISYSWEMHKQYGLELDNSYLFCDEETDNINRIRLIYHSQKIMDMCAARRMLVDVAEGFIKAINSDPVVSQRLTKAPFTVNELEIDIDMTSYYGVYANAQFVGWINLERGMAYYYAFDVYDRKIDRYNSRVEPYYKSLDYVTVEKAIRAKEAENRPPAPQTMLFQTEL